MKHILPSIWLLCCFLLNQVSYAQTPQFRHYTTQDGLPSSTIYGMLQDKKGYMWFGSENGVSCFDGKSFKTFTVKDGLTDNLVLDLFEDSKGRIWFFTLNGKLCFYLNDTIYNARNNSLLAKLPDISVVYSCMEETNGDLYFASIHHLMKVTNNGYEYLTIPPDVPNYVFKITSNIGYFMWRWGLFDANKSQVFCTIDGLYLYEKDSLKELKSYDAIPFNVNPHIHVRLNDEYWIGNYGLGVVRVQNITSPQPTYTHFLKGVQVNNVFHDREGNLWFTSSDKGVFMLPDYRHAPLHWRKENGLEQEDIHVIHTDRNNIIWAGSVSNHLYAIKNDSVYVFTLINSTNQHVSSVYDLIESTNGKLYMINSYDIYELDPSVLFSKPKNSIIKPMAVKNKRANYKALSLTNDGKLYVGSPHDLIHVDLSTNVFSANELPRDIKDMSNRLFTVFVSSKGIIWVANKKGLNILDKGVLKPAINTGPMQNQPISKIIELQDGNLLIATRSMGLFLYDGKKVIQEFSDVNGLPSNICNKIKRKGNDIWVATARGLSHLVYKKNSLVFIRNYTLADGLLSNEINDVAINHESIYVATADGISELANQTLPEQTLPPPVYFTSISYGDSHILQQEKSIQPYSKANLKIDFIAVTFHLPQQVVYQYRMIGVDDHWQNNVIGTVEYQTIQPGDYTFELRARKGNSGWSEAISFQIHITAPFWMQAWFYILVYIVGLALVSLIGFVFIRSKRKQKLRQVEMKNQMLQLEQQALGAMMNPHFIFNALNSIQHYLQQNDRISANKYLTLFARLTRQNMEAVMHRTVSLEDELERLELYIQFEELRFGNKLHFELIIPEHMPIDEFYLPPMILQPFVENAIWHGIMPKANGGNIILSLIEVDDKKYKVCIKDDGIGYLVSKQRNVHHFDTHQSKGLQLITDRLQLWTKQSESFYDLQIEQWELPNKEVGGTIVTLTLPIIKEYN